MTHVASVVLVGSLMAVCLAAPSPASVNEKPAAGRITPGIYTTQAVPGTEALRGYMYRFNLFPVKTERINGHRVALQSIAFLKWLQETAVPATGVVHYCGMDGIMPISPPGLPNGTPAGLLEYRATSPVAPVVASTGKPVGWPDAIAPPGPERPFAFHGKFNEKKHLIKITGTCDGVTQTHTYRLTHRF